MAATTGKGKIKKDKWKVQAKMVSQSNKLLRKELARSKKQLDKWRQKSRELKLLRIEVKRLRSNRDNWRDRYRGYKKDCQWERVKGHPYSLALMLLGVQFHITYGISLRATAKALHSVGLMYGQRIKKISSTTVRNWSLRVGLYFLTQRIAVGRYVLIADESISMGQEKLLVMLLVKVECERMSRISPLVMSDVEVLHIQAKTSWKGADISAIIEEKLRENQGVEIAYSVSDKGSNLRNAFSLCGIKWLGDCTHIVSNHTRVLFQKDSNLNELVKAMNGTRAKWALSHLAVYSPPALRKKARFHQIFAIYKWALPILGRWDQLPPAAKDEMVYLQKNRGLIQAMRQIHCLIEDFSALIKGKGINSCTESQWENKYAQRCKQWEKEQLTVDTRVKEYHQKIVDYIAQTKSTLPDETQILCCSDVIESIFGKYKNKGRCPMITDDALKIAAYPRNIQKQDVLMAMETRPTKEIEVWKNKNTTVSLLAQKLKFKQKMAA